MRGIEVKEKIYNVLNFGVVADGITLDSPAV